MFVKEKCVCIGKIVRTHGIHGQLVVLSDLEILENDVKESILVDIDGGLVPFFVREEGWKNRDNQSYFVHFEHLNSKEQANRYCGLSVYLEYFNHKEFSVEDKKIPSFRLDGYTVYDSKELRIGEIVEFLDYSSNFLLRVVTDEKKELLLPLSEEHLLEVDDEKKIVIMQISDGLLDL